MAKQTLLVGNWKENPATLAEARKLFAAVAKAASSNRISLVVCPPALFLSDLSMSYRGSRILFGAQDISFEKGGSHTGEISGDMLKSVKAKFAIAGHSERRAQGETGDVVGRKVAAALQSGIRPILCVGERSRDEHGDYFHTIEEQVLSGVKHVSEQSLSKLVIAYEPVFAIGKKADDALKPADVHEMAIFIRKILSQKYSRTAVDKVSILYGGSVEPENAAGLMTDGGVAGFLVGHVSIEPARFKELLAILRDL